MFSLCIPTMDRFDFLKSYLPKYINNNLVREIIICDENGNDYKKISENFQNAKIKLYVNDKKLGPFLNKLKCCKLASSQWIALIDSDNFADEKYFETALNFIQLNKCNNRTILSPSFAKPTFDYRKLIGMLYKKNNFKVNRQQEIELLGSNTKSQTLMNTGNYVINRYLIENLNVESNMSMIENSSACDVILMNTMLFQQLDAEMHILKDMEYEHVVHDGSIYVNTHAQTKYTCNTVYALNKGLI